MSNTRDDLHGVAHGFKEAMGRVLCDKTELELSPGEVIEYIDTMHVYTSQPSTDHPGKITVTLYEYKGQKGFDFHISATVDDEPGGVLAGMSVLSLKV